MWLIVVAFGALVGLARRTEGFWIIAAPAQALSLLATFGHAFFSFPKERPQAAMFPYLLMGIISAGGSLRRSRPLPCTIGRLLLVLLLALSIAGVELSRRQVGFDRHYLRALWAEDRADWGDVMEDVGQAIRFGVYRPHVLVIRGRAEEKMREYPKAEESYRRALDYEPHDWHAHNGLGVVLKRQRRYEEALSHYREALSIYSNSMDVRNNLGALYKSMGDLDRVEQEFGAVLRANPDDAGALNNMGNICKARGNLSRSRGEKDRAAAQSDSAAAFYRKALKSDPRMVQAHYNLADLHRLAGRSTDAILHYRDALALDPREPRIPWGLGMTLESSGDVAGAELAYRMANELDPTFAEGYFSLADLVYRLRRYSDAADAYLRFLELWNGAPGHALFAEKRLAECRKRMR